MNPTVTRVILPTLVLISCATKAAELPSSKASKNAGPVLALKPERKRPLRIGSISVILSAQRANKAHEMLKRQKNAILKEMHSSEETVNSLSNSPDPRILAKAQRKELRTQKEQHKAAIALCPREQQAQFAAILRKERKATKDQFRQQRLELDDYFKTCCTRAEETRTMATESLDKLKAVKQGYDRIDQLRQLNNASAHKAYTESKRQRRQ